MTVLEFLASYAALFLQRAETEGLAPLTVLYNETETHQAYAYVGNAAGGGVTLMVGFGLFDELTEQYTPELTDEQWELFKGNIQP